MGGALTDGTGIGATFTVRMILTLPMCLVSTVMHMRCQLKISTVLDVFILSCGEAWVLLERLVKIVFRHISWKAM